MKIGIDLGGHTIMAARVAVSVGGVPKIDRTETSATPKGRSIRDVVSALAETVQTLAAGCEISGVGLAVPGMVDADRRHVRKMPNFPEEWDDLDVSQTLAHVLQERGFSFPVVIENDANCYALGEGHAGEAARARDFVVLTMGTGLGCGIVVGGRLLVGAHGMAGEAGHIVVAGNAPCGCGGCGHAETLAAADGTVRRALAEGLPGDFREVWARRGTPAADRALEPMLDAMARTVATIWHILDPEMVVIGGGMSQAEGIREAIAERTRAYLSRPFKEILDLRISKLGNTAALYGAASLQCCE